MQPMGFMFLARFLPLRVARRLGATVGRVSGRLPGTARRRALANLGDAFPELESSRVARLAAIALAHRGRLTFDGVAACRLDSRALCRRLTLSGWSHLDAAENREQGTLVLGAGFGCWQVAALAVALYRGPLETLGPWRADPIFGRLAASFERPSGRRLFGELAGGEQLEWTLRTGERVGFLADQAAGHGEAVDVPFLGGTVRAKPLIARASIDSGAPVVPVFGRPLPRGRWSVEVRPPIWPQGADAHALTALYLEEVEREVRLRPELWPWWR